MWGRALRLGVLFAREGEIALAAFFAGEKNKIVLDLSLNGRMLLFTVGVALLTGSGVRNPAGARSVAHRSVRRIAGRVARHCRKPFLAAVRPRPGDPAGGAFHGLAGRRGPVYPKPADAGVGGPRVHARRRTYDGGGAGTAVVRHAAMVGRTSGDAGAGAQDTGRTLGQLGHDEPVERTRPGSVAGDPRVYAQTGR